LPIDQDLNNPDKNKKPSLKKLIPKKNELSKILLCSKILKKRLIPLILNKNKSLKFLLQKKHCHKYGSIRN